MKSRWREGTTHVSFSPLDFIARLVALIPPPRVHMIRYSGCFAPNFKDRRFIVKNASVPKRGSKVCNDVLPEKISAEIVFTIQRNDCQFFAPADDIDPEYGRLLREATAAGVKVSPLILKVDEEGVTFEGNLLPLKI